MTTPDVKPARERIVDAAAAVMREKGIAGSTTKSIAAAAGYSEAMLYKHFADKQELFLTVLKERLPVIRPATVAAGSGDLAENLTAMMEQLLAFFVEVFPITGSLLGSPDLLSQHRAGILERGGTGPTAPVRLVASYLDAEVSAGRIRDGADTHAAAQLLVGAAFQEGFFAMFEGRDGVADAHRVAGGLVAAVLPALVGPPQ